VSLYSRCNRALLLNEFVLSFGLGLASVYHVFVLAGHFALEVSNKALVATIGRETSNQDHLENLSSQFQALALGRHVESVFRSAGLLLANKSSENVVNSFEAILL